MNPRMLEFPPDRPIGQSLDALGDPSPRLMAAPLMREQSSASRLTLEARSPNSTNRSMRSWR